MDNETVKREVQKADRYMVEDGRVVLVRLVWKRERVASFPTENLTDENWNTVKCVPKAFNGPDRGGTDEATEE